MRSTPSTCITVCLGGLLTCTSCANLRPHPPTSYGQSPEAFAVTLGAILLLVTRLISWRLLAAQLIGLLVFAWLATLGSSSMVMPAHWHLLLGSFAFGAVFIACDPVASACTNPGRWIQGFLIAALLVLIRTANPTHPDAVVPVLLLASLLAPLIDHGVIAWDIRKRGRRHV